MKLAKDIIENITQFHDYTYSVKDLERYILSKLSQPKHDQIKDDIHKYSNGAKFSFSIFSSWCKNNNVNFEYDELNEVYSIYPNSGKYKGWSDLIHCMENPNSQVIKINK